MENPPNKINEIYAAASKQDNQYHQAQAMEKLYRGGTSSVPKQATPWRCGPTYKGHKGHASDPDAMDVDRLFTQEQQEHFRKGQCFVCHQVGHRAKDCPKNLKRSTTNRTPPKNEGNAYTSIKAILDGLEESERTEFFKKAEEIGF